MSMLKEQRYPKGWKGSRSWAVCSLSLSGVSLVGWLSGRSEDHWLNHLCTMRFSERQFPFALSLLYLISFCLSPSSFLWFYSIFSFFSSFFLPSPYLFSLSSLLFLSIWPSLALSLSFLSPLLSPFFSSPFSTLPHSSFLSPYFLFPAIYLFHWDLVTRSPKHLCLKYSKVLSSRGKRAGQSSHDTLQVYT